MFFRWSRLLLPVVFVFSTRVNAQQATDPFANTQTFLSMYCKSCHQGQSPAGGFDIERLSTPASLGRDPKWTAAISRVRNREMPPKGSPAPDLDGREKFAESVESALHSHVCADGISPGPSLIRRLNREEYTATVQYLLDLHMDIGQALPADGAGGEGFDNAAEALVLSPIHAEKYMEAAKLAMDFASKEFKSRKIILIAKPGPGVSPGQAAQEILKTFLPRAFRRPVTENDIAPYMALFRAAQKQGQSFESADLLHSSRRPDFSRVPVPQRASQQKSRSSSGRPIRVGVAALVFSMGHNARTAAVRSRSRRKIEPAGGAESPGSSNAQDERSVTFADRFVGQWLRTRELGTNKIPDPKMFPGYANEELRSDIRYQPILFFREIFSENLSLVNLIDSKYTILTGSLSKHYDVKPVGKKANQQPQWVELPADSQRGGLLGMAAVLGVSSYPHRTSPVLRGAWVLESLLGTPPPPPPPNVPALPEDHSGTVPTSVRERLTLHRANPVCASCHARIDPLGFALENFDALGRWRDEDGGKPVDSSAELIDGTKIQGPAQLKTYLLDRKDLVIRNLASKMLGYALGRGLTPKDSCVIDDIMAQVKDNDYSAQTLIEATVLSVPFRYQAPHSQMEDRSA